MTTWARMAWMGLIAVLAAVSPADAAGRRLEILFLGDNGHHKPAERFPQLQQTLGVRGINLTYTDRMADLNAATLAGYDGLMIYANITQIGADQEKAMLDFVAAGKGLLPIHCASYCFHNSDAYITLVGAQFKAHKTGSFTVPVAAPDHSIMKGFVPFETWDETYIHHRHNEDRTVLQFRDDEGGHKEPWTWVRNHGKGRVFYTAYGHDERTWGNSAFQDLITRGIRWAVGDAAVAALDALALPPLVYSVEPTVQNYEKRTPYPQYQQPLPAAESRKLTQWPVGFHYELFASEPDIVKPIFMAFDARGRCWIAETVDYPNIVNDDRKGRDRIRVLEDTNNDGKADKFTVFVEGINIPTSFAFHQDGIIVAAAPNFYFMRDTNGDDRCDETKTISTGWGVHDTHAGPSNLQYGFDNYFYGAVGYSGFNGKVGDQDVRFNSGLFRFKADFSELEFLSQFSNNTWGLGFNEAFDLFGSTANNTHSVYIGIANRFYQGIAGLKAPRGKKIDGHYAAYPITDKIRQVDVMGGFTAAAGHNLYTARSFPQEYWNRMAFVAEPTMHLLANSIMERDGAGYREVNGWNLTASADEWYAPVHAQVGPDGAVWILDWYNFIIQHNPTPSKARGGFDGTNGKGGAHENPLRDQTHGRIWRVVYDQAPPNAPRTLRKDDVPGLLGALQSDNLFWRLTAQRLLVERGQKDVVPQLITLVRTAPMDAIGICGGAVHALYTLQGLGALEGDALAAAGEALRHKSHAVRKAALQVLPRTVQTADLLVASGILADADLNVRKDALLAVSLLPATDALGAALLTALQQPETAKDEWLSDAAMIAAVRQGLPLLRTFATGSIALEATAKGEIKRKNLFLNGNFENVAGTLPRDWKVRTYGGKASHRAAAKEGRNGSMAVEISSSEGADSSLFQDVDVVKGRTYEWSGWIRTENIKGAAANPGRGAQFNAHTQEERSDAVSGTSDWRRISFTFVAAENRVSCNLLFGGWGYSIGKAWYDDVELVDLSDAGGSLLQRALALTADNVGRNEVAKLASTLPAAPQGKLFTLLKGPSALSKAELTGPELLAAGRKVFQEICFACHGPNGGGTVGPNLTDMHFIHGPTLADMDRTVRKGVIEKGMLPWEQTLDEAQLKAVIAYTWTLRGTHAANGKPPEGQPAPGPAK